MEEEMTPELWRQWAIETAINRNLVGTPFPVIKRQAQQLLDFVLQDGIESLFKEGVKSGK